MILREALPADVDRMVELVHELALYERAPEQCHLTSEQLHERLFGESPAVFGHVAEIDGQVVGICIWFLNFSTWDGVHGIYLEDLYVTPEARGRGIGKASLQLLARICIERGHSRLQWQVLDWNTPSIQFYESLGSVDLAEWRTHRLSGDALVALAQSAD